MERDSSGSAVTGSGTGDCDPGGTPFDVVGEGGGRQGGPGDLVPTPRASVLSRALGILSAFSRSSPTLTLTEISRSVGLPLSTTHRLTAELVEWGALERDEFGRFHIGLRLWEVGVLAPRSIDLRDAAMPFLGDIYAATGQNVLLAIIDDNAEVMYIERISGPESVQMASLVGTRMPLHASGVGLALLAYAPWELRQRILSSRLIGFTDHTITDPNHLRQVLAQVRRQGFAISERQIDLAATSIAAPVFGPGGTVVAALSLVVPSSTNWRSLVPAVVTAARGLSRAIGMPPHDHRRR